jgi:hypothetical protein
MQWKNKLYEFYSELPVYSTVSILSHNTILQNFDGREYILVYVITFPQKFHMGREN